MRYENNSSFYTNLVSQFINAVLFRESASWTAFLINNIKDPSHMSLISCRMITHVLPFRYHLPFVHVPAFLATRAESSSWKGRNVSICFCILLHVKSESETGKSSFSSFACLESELHALNLKCMKRRLSWRPNIIFSALLCCSAQCLITIRVNYAHLIFSWAAFCSSLLWIEQTGNNWRASVNRALNKPVCAALGGLQTCSRLWYPSKKKNLSLWNTHLCESFYH